MNYYQFHLGDYAAHTRHLSLMEDLAYRRMIDLYYTNEEPLPLDVERIARLVGMRDHMQEISDVLSDFFVKSEGGYINSRCDKEIEAYRAKADRARSANKARWNQEKSNDRLKSDVESDVNLEENQIPTKNQEPRTNITPLPHTDGWELPDWVPSELWMEFEDVRKKRKKPMTNRARQLAVNKLKTLVDDGHDVKALLEQSILHAWDTFYPLKTTVAATANEPWANAI